MAFKDVQEQITSIRETNKGGAEVIWTSYDYDPLNQIVEVIDDKNNRTRVSYDNLGRRTVIDNPDTGRTETRYDPAGNVTAKITATLAKTGKQISYDYDFNRLKTLSYPDFPGNNVAYTYGGLGAIPNRAGRIVTVSDQSGKEERFYGKLGELTKEIKTVASKTQGNSANSPEVYETSYTFDTFGRLQRLVYPDGETLTNLYDSGGLLRAATGIRGSFRYDYLKRLEYDKFEQRAFVQYGNNVRSNYSYDPYNRRLANLRAGKGDGNLFQNILYGYDKVGNILSLKNDVAIPSPNEYGGPTDQGFRYDDLYRLTDAQGIYQFASGKLDIYSFAMSYDTIHNILNKNQEHQVVQPSGTLVTQKKTTYNWNYAYNNQKPHAPVHIGERTYSYDDNGNQTGWTSDVNGTRRNIVWDEENRIQSIFDNGHQKEYVYNDAGDRVIKRGPQGETVYVNQFFVVRNRSIATKHIFAGNSRIATRMMPGTNGTTNLGSTTTATTFPGQGLYHRSAQGLLNGKNNVNNPNYQSGAVTTNGNGTPGNTDNFLYFYHPDHLGSTSFVTDVNGKLYEHIEYFPFGETWVEEHSNTQRTPYLFTGKELDEETGLYYFGARYYDPRTSVWQSADPILGKYLPSGNKEKDKNLAGMGGVFNGLNLSLYTCSHENPVKFLDFDGKETAKKPILDFKFSLGWQFKVKINAFKAVHGEIEVNWGRNEWSLSKGEAVSESYGAQVSVFGKGIGGKMERTTPGHTEGPKFDSIDLVILGTGRTYGDMLKDKKFERTGPSFSSGNSTVDLDGKVDVSLPIPIIVIEGSIDFGEIARRIKENQPKKDPHSTMDCHPSPRSSQVN